ncbi:A13CA protein, partial [Phaetusa simplex]|nr:A13CA protein [Phaetusa simplex]
ECAHLLLAHNAPVKVKNAQGWSPLAEAISYGDRQMITALLRKLKQQSRESVEEKRPRLLKALKELGDFYLELHWDFQSWVPLLSRILPSDACKIHKQGINIRLDTTLIDFTDMKCQRGDLSFIFNGDAAPSESFVVLDNEQKVYQRIHHEVRICVKYLERFLYIRSLTYFIKPNVPLKKTQTSSKEMQTKGFFERVGNFLADFYLVNGLVLESRKRREHLSEEDILRNKAIMESLSKGGNLMEQNFEPVRRQSLTPPSPNTITWEEYISAENGKAPHLGRELVCKESKKTFKATIAMSQEFPLGIESLLNVLEVIAPFKHFNKLREFVQMKLPPGFPVKLDIPVFPTITATVTFQEFRYDEFDESIFTIPDDYKEDPSRFPDL